MRKTIRVLLVVGLASLALAAVAAVQLGATRSPDFHGTEYPDAPLAPAFSLVDHTGRTVSLGEFRGVPVLLFFGFTECPDVCPLTLRKLDRLLRDAGIGPDEVSVLLVTVDPATDTPDRLASYVTGIGPSITGLTGESQQIEAVLGQYGAFAQPSTNHAGEPVVAHTSLVFGIDREGRLRVLIHADEPDELVLGDIRELMRIGG
ncbi:MAG: SCO family protein [Gemmatimonadota bacterium]